MVYSTTNQNITLIRDEPSGLQVMKAWGEDLDQFVSLYRERLLNEIKEGMF